MKNTILFLIIIISLSLLTEGCINQHKIEEYSYYFEVDIDSNDSFEYYILIPIVINSNQTVNRRSMFITNPSNLTISVENKMGEYFYNISTNTSFQAQIIREFDGLDLLNEFTNNIPRLNYEYSPSNNSDKNFYIFFSDKYHQINIEIILDIDYNDGIYRHLKISGDLTEGWNKMNVRQDTIIS